jgi:3D-(3,5/4)-trihydroxycyclohexane-1,2-dione acylhydrolase (decyclizing)
VTISLHQDVQAEAYDFPVDLFAERTWRVARRQPDPGELEAALSLIRAAERPLIVAGGGIHYARAEAALAQFAEQVGAGVAETSAGKGAMRGHELALGAIGHSGTRAANALARRADLVVCVGTRLIDLTTGSNTLFEHPSVRFIGINVSAADAYKLGALPVQADAQAALEALADGLAQPIERAAWLDEIAVAKRRWLDDLEADLAPREGERMSQAQVLAELNRHSGADDALVVASGTPHVDIHKLFDPQAGTRVYMEVGFSCMGHEIPAALGVRMANRHPGEVFVVIGDGTYLMASSELVTAVQEGLKITVLIAENHGYQSIHALQRGRIGRSFGLEFRGRDGAGELEGPYVEVDLAANARSYGVEAYVAETIEEVRAALESARAANGPCVIVARVEPQRLMLDSQCWWDVGVPQVAASAETREAVVRSDAGRSTQRFFG